MQAPGGATGWKEAIQRDGQLRPRIRGGAFKLDGPTKDAVSGAVLERFSAYLRLADPSGKEVPLTTVKAALPTSDPAPLPATAAGCHDQLAAGRQRLAELNLDLAGQQSPEEIFARSAPNPGLTARMQPIVVRALQGPEAFAPAVECRAQLCRVTVAWRSSDAAKRWKRQLSEDQEFRRHSAGGPMSVGGTELIFTLVDPTRPFAGDLVGKLRETFIGSPGVRACAAQFPGAVGRLEARFTLSDAERPDDGAAPGVLHVSWGGPLVDTPLARCLEDVAAPLLAAVKVPARVRGVVKNRDPRLSLAAGARRSLRLPLPGVACGRGAGALNPSLRGEWGRSPHIYSLSGPLAPSAGRGRG